METQVLVITMFRQPHVVGFLHELLTKTLQRSASRRRQGAREQAKSFVTSQKNFALSKVSTRALKATSH